MLTIISSPATFNLRNVEKNEGGDSTRNMPEVLIGTIFVKTEN